MSPYADPTKRRDYHCAWKRRNRGRYADKDATYARVRNANRRAREAGACGVLTSEDVEVVMAAGRCHYCHGTHLLGIDHVIPLALGGPNERGNLVCCCRSCNASKERADRPRRWSRQHDACQDCGECDRPHGGHGLCERCYQRKHKRPRVVRSL